MSAEGLPVAVRTLGCKVNRVESEDIVADLLGRGVRLAEEDEAAVIVVNTCTVTGEADAKARKAVRQALKAAGEPVVVVTGCLAALEADSLRALGERVVVEADKGAVAQRVAEALGLEEEPHGHAVRVGEAFRTRAMLKVEDGCDNFCTYCIVPHARGVPRSVPLADVIRQSAALLESGAREIVLTGINVGRYRDASTGADLADLIETVASTGVGRLRLSSIEPPDITERLIAAMASRPAFCEHLHVPLQSGSDRVLFAMGRTYTAAEYCERIEAARAALPGLAITTDVIAGFPGETDSDADRTRALCERLAFAKLHVFRYSARPGTPAADMAEQVAPELRAARAEALRASGDALRARYVASRSADRAEVLVERVVGGRAEGTTRDYLRVRFETADAEPGGLVEVALGQAEVS